LSQTHPALNTAYFIAAKIARNKQSTFSSFIIRLATAATILSVAVMIMAVAIVQGFKTTIRDKMFIFWGHAQVALFDPNPSAQVASKPFRKDPALLQQIRSHKGIQAVYPYIVKPGIIKANNSLEGIKLKGVEADYPLKSNTAIGFSGRPIQFPDSGYAQEIILSQSTMDRLRLKIGGTVLVVFFDPESEVPPVRKLTVVGTYHTGMEEIDKSFGICDIRLLRRVSNWAADDISAIQINMADYRTAQQTGEDIYQSYLQPPMSVSTIKDIYPFIFSWLDFQNVNTRIILIIMGLVAAINMATALLIFILERTHMIGVLKALGMSNAAIQRTFSYHAARIALKGVLWGTLLGVGLCLLQQYTHLIQLNENTYYMKAAPIELKWWYVVLIDLGTLIFCTLIMILPSLIVRKVNIVQALRFR
jgi:lipoprotein-releasing system permease protein